MPNMKLGAMNDPKQDLYKQITWIGENRFNFLDLTLEPEKSYSEDVDVDKVKKLLKKYKLDIIGHTPWSLPLASPYKSVRKAALDEFYKCLDVFSKLGVKLVNVHPFMPHDLADPDKILQYNIESFRSIVKKARDIDIMMENTQGIFNELGIIAKILEDVKGLWLHWDIGHANLGNEGEKKTKLAFMKFDKKIKHLHLSDNNGTEDQHLPIGTGNIHWPFIIEVLKEHKYKKTITLEIHSLDLSYILFTRDKLNYLLKST